MIVRTTFATAFAAVGLSLAVLTVAVSGAFADEMSKMAPTKENMANQDMMKNDMAKDAMSKDDMAKDEMAKEGMAKDGMAKDEMAHDAMKNETKDEMKP
ncbi:MAG: pentapeptide MXKDX repeat protein [Pseudomonadota bacterium]